MDQVLTQERASGDEGVARNAHKVRLGVPLFLRGEQMVEGGASGDICDEFVSRMAMSVLRTWLLETRRMAELSNSFGCAALQRQRVSARIESIVQESAWHV